MKHSNLKRGMIVKAWTSTHGVYKAKVIDFSKEGLRMTRVICEVIEVLEKSYKNRHQYIIGEYINVGISCISEFIITTMKESES